MNFDENLNLQSNLFSFLIHLSILFVMIFTVQWSPQYPYFGEVELWEAVPTVKEQAQTPPKPKQAEPVKIEKSTPKVNQEIKDTQAEINLKKKKEKELAEKKKQEQIKKVQQELLKTRADQTTPGPIASARAIRKITKGVIRTRCSKC